LVPTEEIGNIETWWTSTQNVGSADGGRQAKIRDKEEDTGQRFKRRLRLGNFSNTHPFPILFRSQTREQLIV
jgi:hypothetical protein